MRHLRSSPKLHLKHVRKPKEPSNNHKVPKLRLFFFSLFVFYLKHNSRPYPTSRWHPHVKLSARGPAAHSPAREWVCLNPEPFFEVPGSQTGAVPQSHHPSDKHKVPKLRPFLGDVREGGKQDFCLEFATWSSLSFALGLESTWRLSCGIIVVVGCWQPK